jgi:hypothetical protein
VYSSLLGLGVMSVNIGYTHHDSMIDPLCGHIRIRLGWLLGNDERTLANCTLKN